MEKLSRIFLFEYIEMNFSRVEVENLDDVSCSQGHTKNIF